MSRVDHVYNVLLREVKDQNLSYIDVKKLQSKIGLFMLTSSFNEDYGYDDLDEEL